MFFSGLISANRTNNVDNPKCAAKITSSVLLVDETDLTTLLRFHDVSIASVK